VLSLIILSVVSLLNFCEFHLTREDIEPVSRNGTNDQSVRLSPFYLFSFVCSVMGFAQKCF